MYSNVPLTAYVCTYCSDTSLHADTATDVATGYTGVTGDTEVDCETHF